MKYKAAIFDLDGTLIDSVGIWNLTDQKLIHNYSGKKFNNALAITQPNTGGTAFPITLYCD